MQTIDELKKMDAKELEKALAKGRFDLYTIQTALRVEKSQKSNELKLAKKHVAHILTVMNSQKEQAQTAQQ